jgi:hypothetical protein
MTEASGCVPDACGGRRAAQKGAKTNIERARELQALVEHPAAGLLPNAMLAHPHPEDAIEEAELMDNLGEFPLRTDQGDRITTPMTKQRAREFLRRR